MRTREAVCARELRIPVCCVPRSGVAGTRGSSASPRPGAARGRSGRAPLCFQQERLGVLTAPIFADTHGVFETTAAAGGVNGSHMCCSFILPDG